MKHRLAVIFVSMMLVGDQALAIRLMHERQNAVSRK